RLHPRQQDENDDRLYRRVYPTIPASRVAEGIRPHPPLRRDGQLPTVGIDSFVHEAVRRALPDPFSRKRPAKRNLAVPSMSHSHDPHRKANSSSTLLAILLGGFREFFVVVRPSEIFDVLRHVPADVCLPVRISAIAGRNPSS